MVTIPCEKILNSSNLEFLNHNLSLKSTVQELYLYDFQIDCSCLGKEIGQIFEENLLLPGIILTENNNFYGMISRRRFLEKMSRPYSLELFLKRPIKCLYSLTKSEILVLPGNTTIVAATKKSLQRPPELLYEPIVVVVNSGVYRLLDIHHLLVAQGNIHELTTKMLDEQTEAQMLQTEKMASLGKMVAGIAHEIRNPVNYVYGNLDFLSNHTQDLIEMITVYQQEVNQPSSKIAETQEDIDLDFILQDLPKIIQSMKMGAERLIKIIGGLQNFSHMDETNPQLVDLHECIDSTLLILHNRLKQGIEVIKNYGDFPLVKCYSGQISQVFMNLISNAIDALMEKLAEEESQNWQPKIEITTQALMIQNQPWVSIQIADNGLGIKSEIQSKIFETFFTTKPVGKGTGLGLAISHQIVTQKHQGKLQVRSQPNLGTEFEILLPLF